MAEAGVVASPCVRLCTLDEQQVCVGCHRHIDEIVGWAALDAAGKRHVLDLAQQRREAAGRG